MPTSRAPPNKALQLTWHSALRSPGLIGYPEPGCVKAEPVLFLEG